MDAGNRAALEKHTCISQSVQTLVGMETRGILPSMPQKALFLLFGVQQTDAVHRNFQKLNDGDVSYDKKTATQKQQSTSKEGINNAVLSIDM